MIRHIRMNFSSKLLSATALVLAISFSAPMNMGFAQEKAPNGIVAKLGDTEVTEKELALVLIEMQERLKKMPEAERRLAALNSLIDIKLLAQKAKTDDSIDKKPIEERLNFQRDRLLHNSYFQDKIATGITDEQLKARYDKEVASTKPEEEVKARHILVKTKEEAVAIIKELDAGADFVELAKTKSTGPSGPKGGDLGFFAKGQMVPSFEKAAFALEIGKHTAEPVQSQFGFHIIKLDNRRTAEPPAFDQVKSQMMQVVMRERYLETVRAQREAVKVEILDPALKAQSDAAEANK